VLRMRRSTAASDALSEATPLAFEEGALRCP
jgi:hypothetical protein